ncbi:hypothetical protein [Paraburkholderia sediminicola]|uniref:hypothetical protein n=1 Tax=Paraburkholderia sediminicola TaxID=458836 RepID=UPI001583160C|nr:hypothetical protein [Paraburkholderia sediminicola]
MSLAPDAHGCVAASCWVAGDKADPVGSAEVAGSGVALALAKAVFADPGCNWQLDLVARQMGCSVRQLQVILFTQNASFTQIVTKQRLMRTLFCLLGEGGAAIQGVFADGWRDRRELERLMTSELLVELDAIIGASPMRFIGAVSSRSGGSLEV